MSSSENEPVYLDLATESADPSVTQLESVCMNCMEKGITRLLLTLIPHYREVMVSSFSCPHCYHTNSSLLSTGAIQEKGVEYKLHIKDARDLKRMLVKSDYATIRIPEVELEVPGRGEKGEITTVEGVISRVCEGLQLDQETRRADNPLLADQIQAFLRRLTGLLQLTEPFTLELHDPTGNSYIERLSANGVTDRQVTFREFERTAKTDQSLGLAEQDDGGTQKPLEEVKEEDEEGEPAATQNSSSSAADASSSSSEEKKKQLDEEEEEEEDEEDIHGEVMQFNTLCDRCQRPAATNMKMTKIPHFKEVVIMATVCEHCGGRSSEVKSGGGIADRGRRIVLTLDEVSLDMARDVLKSETCSVELPQLDMHVGAGVLGGKFTTLEGLLINIKEDLQSNPFFSGDSVETDRKEKVEKLFSSIDKVLSGEFPSAIIVLDDPAGNSYLQNIYAPDPDPNMLVTEYERSHEQNEDLGLNDIKTEGYEENE